MDAEDSLTIPPADQAYFRKGLLRWFKRNRRQFPWRQTDDPYLILLSEVLLQRTQAQQVDDNYRRVVGAFPTPQALAAAPINRVRQVLRPLGLAKRASSLKKMGRELVVRFDGKAPTEITDLVTLPGVGRYIATATACFAASARVAVVDANVVRVFSRFFGLSSKKKRPRDDEMLWQFANSLLPRRGTKDYNRGLIDFASLVCRPRRPSCATCPLRRRCCAAPTFLSAGLAVAQDGV